MSASHDPCLVAGKYRRLKTKVVKVSRFERELFSHERDEIIQWWNKNQRLVRDDDPICAKLATDMSAAVSAAPIAGAQVAGYFSWLCRLGLEASTYRNRWAGKALVRGVIGVTPIFSRALVFAIRQNYKVEQEDKKIRRAAHEKMRAEAEIRIAEREVQKATKTATVPTAIITQVIPEQKEPVQLDLFDIL